VNASFRILLIIGGGIAAYKSLELVRLISRAGGETRTVLTRAGAEFVTPMSLAALSGNRVHESLFSADDEVSMGHIELSRWADLVVVAPATAGLIAKMASGLADDLASTALLATDKPVLLAPAMNVRMWEHPAVQRNVAWLRDQGVHLVGPDVGEMACGETGPGRMSEPEAILAAIHALIAPGQQPLAGRRALVTAGPTFEALDPVRGLTNRSSGRQGYAIAEALRDLGAEVTLVSGPVSLEAPARVDRVMVESAEQMLQACRSALPVDVAVLTAAVSDWRAAEPAAHKIKKGESAPQLALAQTPDILASLAAPGSQRPALVIGFAAETEAVLDNARIKLARKGCDWILANDVSGGKVFGAEDTHVSLVGPESCEDWGASSKVEVARRLARRIRDHLNGG
jgi:phosphopantothenoylcysteine decarboxylase / phosphopantothenate---cysteine ligase